MRAGIRPTATVVLALALLGTRPTSSGQSTTAQQPAPTGTAAISGVVTDIATGRPIAGASVSVSPSVPMRDSAGRSVAPLSVLTDPRGRFVFLDLPAAHYTVTARRTGYELGRYEGPASAGVRTSTGQSVTITLADGDWMRDAGIRMPRASPMGIGGRVTDERGEPVVGAAVQLFSRRLVAGRELLLPGAVVTTDDRGMYRFPILTPGRYFVAVLSVQATVPATIAEGTRLLPLGGLERLEASSPPAPQSETRGVSIDVDGRHRLVLSNYATPPPPGGGRPRAYAPVFHPNARAVDEAQAIEVGVATNRADVNFQLVPVPAVSISGHVTGATSDAANMLLRIMPRGAEHLGTGSEVATTLVEADGRFTFLNVPAGTYTLVASPTVPELGTLSVSGGVSEGRLAEGVYGPRLGVSVVYPPGFSIGSAMWWRSRAGAGAWGRMPVGVGDTDISGLAVTLHPAANVRGRIVFDSETQPNPAQRISIVMEPASGDLSLGVPDTWTAAGDASFAFTIGGLQAGRYLLRFPLFSGWIVQSVTMGGVDVTDTGFDAASSQDFSDVVVTASRTGAALSGSVTDPGGRPIATAVIVFPVDAKRWADYGLTPDRLRSTQSNAAGAYTVNGLRDGDYYVAAIPSAQSVLWPDPKFLAAAAGQATKVTLSSRASSTQNLRVSEVIVR